MVTMATYRRHERGSTLKHLGKAYAFLFGCLIVLVAAHANEVISLTPIHRGQLPHDSIRVVALSESSGEFAVASVTGRLQTYSTKGFQARREYSLPGPVAHVQFVNSGRVLAAVTEDGTGRIWQINSNPMEIAFSVQATSQYADASGDGRFIALGGLVYDTQTDQIAGEPLNQVVLAALEVRGSTVLTAGSHDQRVVVRNVQSGLRNDWETQSRISSAALLSDERHVLIATHDASATLWEIDGPGGPRPLKTWNTTGSHALVECARNTPVCAIADETRLQVISNVDLETGFSADLHSPVWTMAISEDGENVTVGDADGYVQLWDTRSKTASPRIQAFDSQVYTLDLGKHFLIAGGYDGSFALFQFRSEP